MSELHKFLFEGLPVRGILLRLTDAWKEILQRRAQNAETGAYPQAVRQLLGEMTAGAVLMQANIRFEGALVLQIFGDGPLKLAVVEVQNDLSLRATAKVVGTLDETALLSQMVNQNNQGKCAITLDPLKRHPGQQPYQGVVPLFDDNKQPIDQFQKVIEHYMLQSEQLDTTLILAANDEVAAGLLIQRMPMQGQNNLSAHHVFRDEDAIGKNEDYRRISILASSLTREELLSLDANALLHRLFW